MLRIGITGASGSGKSYACGIFRSFGLPSIDADAVVHSLYSEKNPCTDALRGIFGEDVLYEDGSVNRTVLAGIVFSDRNQLNLLNRMVHPFVEAEIEQRISRAEREGAKAILLDAPQLFESGIDKSCDYIVAVIAPREFKINNIIKRDGVSREKAEARLANQHNDAFFTENSDFQIYNGEKVDLVTQIQEILKQIGIHS